jgi:putative MFS transporter
VVGYAVGTGATALARGWTDFVVIQLITRMFLFAELALAVVVIAEEFPAHRRAFGISILLAASVGGGVCAAFALGPAMQTRWEWRTLYVAGLLPLLLVIPLRFGVRETGRYASIDHRRRRSSGMFESAFAVWRAPYRRVLVLCVLLFGLIGALVATFPAFYPYFLVTERGFTPTQVSRTVGTAALMGLPAIPLAGWLLDRWGRRVLGVTAPLLCTVGVIAAFNASGSEMDVTMVAMASVFVGTFVLPVQMTYIPELFPTRIRSLAASWISNGVGRALVVASPAVTGALAAELGSIGYAASVMAICGLAAAGIVYAFMPETKGLTLEHTSSDDVQSA